MIGQIHSFQASLEMGMKGMSHTTHQERPNDNFNQPRVINDCFWNINHSVPSGIKNSGFLQLDKIFQKQILREHMTVMKTTIHDFVNSAHGDGTLFINEQAQLMEFQQNQDDILRNPNRAVQNFIANLKDSQGFKQSEVSQLSNILKQNPLLLKLFLVFQQASPSQFKNTLRYLIYLSLVFYQNFRASNNITCEKVINQFISSHHDGIFSGKAYESCYQSYKQMVQIIIYTVVMSAQAHSKNKYYKQLYESSLKLRSTKFQKELNSFPSQKVKKVTVKRRSTFNANPVESMLPKKRHLSND